MLLLLLVFTGCGGTAPGEPIALSSSPAQQPGQVTQSVALEGQAAPLMRTDGLATFRKVSDWGSGFTAEIEITNTASQPLEDWELTFHLPAHISNIWNARVVGTPNNGLYRVQAMSYNRVIQPGQKISLGFQAAPGGQSVTVTQLTLEWPDSSGTPIPDPTPDPVPDPDPDPDPQPDPNPAPDPEPGPSTQVEVQYRVTSDWGHGFGGEIKITNLDSQPLNDWTLEFTLPALINEHWNGHVTGRQGQVYTVGPANWNRNIAPGNTVTFGFNGSPGGSSAQATNFKVSGETPQQPVPDPGPDPNPTPDPTPGPDPDPGPTPDPDPTPDPNPNPNPTPPAEGFLSTDGSRLVDNEGNTFLMNGINWFGMETETFAPHGLWTRSMDSMLDQIAELGYNTLRVPFSNQAFRSGSVPNGIDFHQNPHLVGKSALEILDILVQKAGERNMRIVLDRHRPNAHSQSDLWYTSAVSEEQWIADWEMLAERYRNNPIVIGADLHNEPHGRATWGSGQISTDWRLAAQRAGNRILAVNPDWLIIVEGVESYGGHNYWWGGNLRGAADHPVVLSVPNKLVYSTHDYATSVYHQSWFNAPNFPHNLQGIWDETWGYLLKENIAPVLVGEFGTKFEATADQIWLNELVDYMEANGASFTYWCWNPNSVDTGGILQNDWRTVNQQKQNVLNRLMDR